MEGTCRASSVRERWRRAGASRVWALEAPTGGWLAGGVEVKGMEGGGEGSDEDEDEDEDAGCDGMGWGGADSYSRCFVTISGRSLPSPQNSSISFCISISYHFLPNWKRKKEKKKDSKSV